MLPETELDLVPELVAKMELGLEVQTVKDRPFQAELIIEVEQKLADGNTVQRKFNAMLYRDRHGRVREERTILVPGVDGQPAFEDTLVFLDDPENRVHYSFSLKMKSAHRTTADTPFPKEAQSLDATPWSPQPGQDVVTEPLGFQPIEGLLCEGRLDIVTLPAGTAGSSFQMEIRTERWYAEELQIRLLIKRTDPRLGEATIRLTNLRLEEPPEALFQVPPGYQIEEHGTNAIRAPH
jgi:hypothetical protein